MLVAREDTLQTRFIPMRELVGHLETDGDDDFGYDRIAIDPGRLISPKRDRVHSDLREYGISADAREFAWGTVTANQSADAHGAFQSARTGIGRITRLNALDDGRSFVIRKRSVL